MNLCVDKPDAERLMTSGGDARLILAPETGLNRYYSAPRPSGALAYASSTANDISAAAYARAEAVLAELGAAPAPAVYAARLEAMRYVLSRFDYPDRDNDLVGEPDPQIVGSAASILDADKCPAVTPRTEDD